MNRRKKLMELKDLRYFSKKKVNELIEKADPNKFLEMGLQHMVKHQSTDALIFGGLLIGVGEVFKRAKKIAHENNLEADTGSDQPDSNSNAHGDTLAV